MRCPTKSENANPSHQLHFIVTHPLTLPWPTSWLSSINNVSNRYYLLDYILPCLSLKYFKQLQWGFIWLTTCYFLNISFYQNTIQVPLPLQTLCTSFFIFGGILLYFLKVFHLTSVGSIKSINQNQLLVEHIGLTINLSRTPNTRFDLQPT